MSKRLLIIFITLTGLEFFNFMFLGESFIKLFQVVGVGLLCGIILIQILYKEEDYFPKYFSWPVLLIFIGLFLSMFMAEIGHGQPLQITLISQRFMYYYLAYLALHSLKPSIEDIEKLVLALGLTFAILYLIQFAVYPTILYDVRIVEDRGTVRIFMAGFHFLILAYFMTLSKIFSNFSPIRLIYLLLFASIFILMGTRQIIFSMMLLTILFVLFSDVVKSRVLVFVLMIIAFIPVFVLFQEIFISLVDLSKSQSESFSENVRIRAALFFMTDFFPNKAAYITGNGADSANSHFGYLVQMYKDVYGFYQSDIGLIGDYSKFGAVFIIGVFFILAKIIFGKMSSQYAYIKYFFFSIILTIFTGGGPFAQSDAIMVICMIMYLLDVDRYDRQVEEHEELQTTFEEEKQIAISTTHNL